MIDTADEPGDLLMTVIIESDSTVTVDLATRKEDGGLQQTTLHRIWANEVRIEDHRPAAARRRRWWSL